MGIQVSELVALTILQAQRLGYIALSLNEWGTTNEPEIQTGSKIEIAGAMYTFNSAEDIDPDGDWAGFANSTQIYCKLIVSGTSVTSKLTTTAPTWNTTKQGYYGTNGSSLHRYYGAIYKDSSGNYDRKCIYKGRELIDSDTVKISVDGGVSTDGTSLRTKVLAISSWNMDSATDVFVTHGIEDFTKIVSITGMIINNAGTASYPFALCNSGFTALDGAGVVSVGSTTIVVGRVTGGTFDNAAFNSATGSVCVTYEA
jgi:hypothetical protein